MLSIKYCYQQYVRRIKDMARKKYRLYRFNTIAKLTPFTLKERREIYTSNQENNKAISNFSIGYDNIFICSYLVNETVALSDYRRNSIRKI